MAFWLSAALLNIFGRGSRGPGAVPENRTWTAFSGASSDRSSEAAAAAPGRSRQPPGLARIPAGRRQRGRGGGDAPAPARAGGARFQRPSTAFSARLSQTFRLPGAPPGPEAARPGRTGHRLGPRGDRPTRPQGSGHVALPWSRSSEPGHDVCPPPRRPAPLRTPRPRGPRLARRRRLEKKPRLAAPTALASPGGKHGFALPPSTSPAPLFFFLATSH